MNHRSLAVWRTRGALLCSASACVLVACGANPDSSDNVVPPAPPPLLLGVPTTQTPNPPGTLPDPARPEGTDLMPQVKHIIVLMMENHSYDNYLGMLGRGDGFTLGPDGKPQNQNPAADGAMLVAYPFPMTTQGSYARQDWGASHAQFDDGKMDGFVLTSGAQAMGYWTQADLPFYYSVAMQFPLCDRYFSSVLTQTFPNRRFLQAGTALGMVTTEVPDFKEPPPPAGTIFDKLDKFGISWREYTAGSPEIGLFPSVLLSHFDSVSDIQVFLDDLAADNLPAYSLITPNDRVSEELPQDIHQGEAFSAGIIDAILHSPGWGSTILVFTYDEHGGYYDHVPPPPAFAPDNVPPDPTKTIGVPGGYDRLGFRVPAMILSPYARTNYVSHVVHDHTSILRLIETKWNLGALTYRDANASNLLDALDFSAPPAFAQPPLLSSSAWPANPIQNPP